MAVTCRIAATLLIGCWWAGAAACAADAAAPPPPPAGQRIVPIAERQALLRRIDKLWRKDPDEASRLTRSLVLAGPGEAFPQALYYAAHPMDKDPGGHTIGSIRTARWVAFAVYHDDRLMCYELAPYVDSPDRNLATVVDLMFDGLPYKDPTLFTEYIHKENEPRLGPVVAMLYTWDIRRAFAIVLNHLTDDQRERTGYTLADLAIGDFLTRRMCDADRPQDKKAARDALRELAKDKHWWVRLYAVDVAARWDGFGDDSIKAGLKNDPDPYVRATALRDTDEPTPDEKAYHDLSGRSGPH